MKRVRKFSYAAAGSVLLLAVLSHSGCDTSCALTIDDGLGIFSLPSCEPPRAVFAPICEHGVAAAGPLNPTPGVTLCTGAIDITDAPTGIDPDNVTVNTTGCANGYELQDIKDRNGTPIDTTSFTIANTIRFIQIVDGEEIKRINDVTGVCEKLPPIPPGGTTGGGSIPEVRLFANLPVLDNTFPNFIKAVPVTIDGDHFIFVHSVAPAPTQYSAQSQEARIVAYQLDLDNSMGELTELRPAGATMAGTSVTSLSWGANNGPIAGDIIVMPGTNPHVIAGHADGVHILNIGIDNAIEPTGVSLIASGDVNGFIRNENVNDFTIELRDNHLHNINQLEIFTNGDNRFLFISGTDRDENQINRRGYNKRAITVYQLHGINGANFEAKLVLSDISPSSLGGHTVHEVHGLATGVESVVTSGGADTGADRVRLHIAVTTQRGMNYFYGIITATFTLDPALDGTDQDGTLEFEEHTIIESGSSPITTPPPAARSAITKAEIGGETFLFFAAAASNRIYVYQDNGTDLSNASAPGALATDTPASWIGGASSPVFNTYNAMNYFFAAGPDETADGSVDDGFSVFQIFPSRNSNSQLDASHFLSSSATRIDPPSLLENIVSLDTLEINDGGNKRLFVVAGSSASNENDYTISVFEIDVP